MWEIKREKVSVVGVDALLVAGS